MSLSDSSKEFLPGVEALWPKSLSMRKTAGAGGVKPALTEHKSGIGMPVLSSNGTARRCNG